MLTIIIKYFEQKLDLEDGDYLYFVYFLFHASDRIQKLKYFKQGLNKMIAERFAES